VIVGFGAAYATKKAGALGDSARAMGDVALVTQKKAQEIDRKHNVVERSKQAGAQAWEKAKAMDQKHNILVKTKEFTVFCFASVKDFCVRNRLLERSAEATEGAVTWAAQQINVNANNSASSTNNTGTGSS
jgi:hypothetical protein